MTRWSKIEGMLQKAYTRMNTTVSISTVVVGAKNRYGDMKSNSWSAPISFYAQVKFAPIEAQEDTDMGWRKDLAALTVNSPITELQRVNLCDSAGLPLFKVGDRLTYDAQTFEIRQIELFQPSLDGKPIALNIYGMRGVS